MRATTSNRTAREAAVSSTCFCWKRRSSSSNARITPPPIAMIATSIADEMRSSLGWRSLTLDTARGVVTPPSEGTVRALRGREPAPGPPLSQKSPLAS